MVRSSSLVAAMATVATFVAGATAVEEARPLVFNEPHLPDGLRLAQSVSPLFASRDTETHRDLVRACPMLRSSPRVWDRTYASSGAGGFVVSLPQLFAARVKADFSNAIWNNWYTTLSEESVVKDAQVGSRLISR